MIEESILEGHKGINIYYCRQLPEIEVKAVVILCHGYATHYGYYEELMGLLTEEGYGAYAYDNRGHGRSTEIRGHLERFEEFIEDLDDIVELVRKNHGSIPIYTIGHSMGGLITFHYGIKYSSKITGQIFSAPAIGMPWGVKYIPSYVYELLGKRLSSLKIFPVVKRLCSRNEDYIRLINKDPLCLKYSTIGFYYEFIQRGIKSVNNYCSSYHLPCYILHGKGDRIIPYKNSINVFEKITSRDKRLRLYDDLYHELIKEPEKAEVMKDIVDWLNNKASSDAL